MATSDVYVFDKGSIKDLVPADKRVDLDDDRVLVILEKLTDKQRADAWKAVADGKGSPVVTEKTAVKPATSVPSADRVVELAAAVPRVQQGDVIDADLHNALRDAVRALAEHVRVLGQLVAKT